MAAIVRPRAGGRTHEHQGGPASAATHVDDAEDGRGAGRRPAAAAAADASSRKTRRLARYLALVLAIFAAPRLYRKLYVWIEYYQVEHQIEQAALEPTLPPPRLLEATRQGVAWPSLLAELEDPTFPRVLIIDSRNGLANRLRAVASAMGVAASLQIPLLVLWEINAHVNCSFAELFDREKLPFALFEVREPGYEKQIMERSAARLVCKTDPHNGLLRDVCTACADKDCLNTRNDANKKNVFVTYNYMEAEGGKKGIWVKAFDPTRHTYFRSAFVLGNKFGYWRTASRHLTSLRAAVRPEIASRVVARGLENKERAPLVGMHVRSVFADAATAVGSKNAFDRAQAEYGERRATDLLAWRNASHWSNFAPRVTALVQELGPSARFFVAADTDATYRGLESAFPGKMLRTKRACARQDRCDDRGCDGLVVALIDILSLSRTDFLLASGWSSFSEVAAFWGEAGGVDRGQKPLEREYAGRDFGSIRIVSPPPTPPSPPPPPPFKPFDAVPSEQCPTREDVLNTPSEMRWEMWEDVNCTSGCVNTRCGRPAPCCIKRISVSWPWPCSFLQFGCHEPKWEANGWKVIDTRNATLGLPLPVTTALSSKQGTRRMHRSQMMRSTPWMSIKLT